MNRHRPIPTGPGIALVEVLVSRALRDRLRIMIEDHLPARGRRPLPRRTYKVQFQVAGVGVGTMMMVVITGLVVRGKRRNVRFGIPSASPLGKPSLKPRRRPRIVRIRPLIPPRRPDPARVPEQRLNPRQGDDNCRHEALTIRPPERNTQRRQTLQRVVRPQHGTDHDKDAGREHDRQNQLAVQRHLQLDQQRDGDHHDQDIRDHVHRGDHDVVRPADRAVVAGVGLDSPVARDRGADADVREHAGQPGRDADAGCGPDEVLAVRSFSVQ